MSVTGSRPYMCHNGHNFLVDAFALSEEAVEGIICPVCQDPEPAYREGETPIYALLVEDVWATQDGDWAWEQRPGPPPQVSVERALQIGNDLEFEWMNAVGFLLADEERGADGGDNDEA